METFTPHPNLHPLIAQRRSSRLIDANRPVERWKVHLILEAARSAPSSNNLQPWRYIVFDTTNPEALEAARSCLTLGNQAWANRAPLLILAIAQEIRADGRPNLKAHHDLGLANENLILQAIALGLNIRPMGGFDEAKARQLFNIPAGYSPVVMFAVGYPPTSMDDYPQEIIQKENSPRTRLSLEQIAFYASWAHPLQVEEHYKTGQPQTK